MNKMESYYPSNNKKTKQRTTILCTFQYREAIAQVAAIVRGNGIVASQALNAMFPDGLHVSVDHELTKKHAIFYSDEDWNYPVREVGELRFFYPDYKSVILPIEECYQYLTGMSIIDYEAFAKFTHEPMLLKCEYDDCMKVSPVEEWDAITKVKNGDAYMPIEECFDKNNWNQPALEGMAFYCPRCQKENDGARVEIIEG